METLTTREQQDFIPDVISKLAILKEKKTKELLYKKRR